MSVMSVCTKNIAARLAGKKAIVGLLGALLFSTGCESPFMHKNEVSAGFHPGISMDIKQATVQVSGSQVVAGSAVGVMLSLKDQNGNLWVKPNEQVSFAYSGGGSSGTLSSVVDNKDGTYTSILTGVRAGSASMVTAIINGTPLATEPPKVTVLPGPASLDDSLVVASAPRVSAGSSVNLKFTVTDRYGNPLGASHKGLNVGFDYSGSSIGTFGPVTDNQDGTYSCAFTGTVAGDPSLFIGKVGGVSVGKNFPAPTVQVIAASPGSATLSVSSSLIASGSTSTITLVSRDIYGNPAGSGRSVVFSAVGGTSTGTISQVVDGGGGTYTATFTGIKAGTETTIHAKIDGEEVSTTLPQIRVQPGGASSQKSVVSASASTVVSGGSATLSLTLKDINNNVVDQAGLIVAFTASGGTSTGTIGPVTYQGSGIYSASFTGIKSGTPLIIGATLLAQPAGSGTSPTIAVVPGSYSPILSVITVSAPSVLVNNSVTLTLTAKDANGNQLTSGGLAVGFGYSSGTSVGTIGATNDLGNGVYTANFKGTGSGTAVFVTSSVSGSPILSASPTLIVNPAIPSLALSTVSVSNSIVASGSTATLALTVRDSAGNQIKDSALAIVFTRSGGTSTSTISSASYNSVSGLYTATFTGILAGTATNISATIGGNGITSASPTITVVAGAPSLTQSSISVPSNTVTSGASLPVSVTVRDANGNKVLDGSLAIVISNQGGTSQGTFGSVVYAGTGVYTANFTGTQAGTPTTMAATIGGAAVSAGPQVTVIPGAFSLARSVVSVSPTSIISGQQATLTLTTKDANGNLLGTGGLTVAFAQSIAGMGQIGATLDNGDGTYTAPFTGVLAGGPDLISATINGSAVISSPVPSITVAASTLSLAQSVVSVSNSNIASGSQSNLKLTLKDSAGNIVKTSGLAVSFTQGGGTSTGNITSASYSADSGEYSAVFTGVLAGTATSIGATIGGAAVSSASPTITVVPGALSLAASTVSQPVDTVPAGTTVPVTITPKDASGNTIINNSYTIVFIFQGGTSQGTFGPVTNTGGVYTSNFTGTVAGTPITLGATIDGVPVTSVGPGVTVTVGALSLAQSSVSVSVSSISSGNSAVVTLTPKDAYGNTVKQSGLDVAFTQGGGTSTGSFSAVSFNSGPGTYTADFTGILAGTPTSLGATIATTAVTSAQPTIAVVPGALSLANSIISVPAGSVAAGTSVPVSLTPKDANGNSITDDSLAIVFNNQGGTSQGSYGPVTYSGGVYTSNFTGTIAGTPTTLSASINGSPVTSTGPGLTVTGGAFSLAQSSISASPNSISSGSAASIVLTPKDAYGNLLKVSGLTIAFAQGGGTSTGSFSAVAYNSATGAYSATFTGVLAGTPTSISATINGGAVSSASPSVAVVPGSFSLANSVISVPTGSVVAGSSVPVSLTPKDANGNAITDNTLVIIFNNQGGTSQGSYGPVTYSGGVYTSNFTGTIAGTPTTLGASINGSTVTSTGPGLSVIAGSFSLAQSSVSVSPSTVASGTSSTVTLTPKDAYGNRVSNSDLAVAFTQAGGTSTGNFSAVTYNSGDAVYRASFTGVLAGTATSIGATIGGSAVTSTLPTITVGVGALSLANSFITTSSPSVASGGTVTLTFTARDAAGNLRGAASDGLTVVFSATGGTSTGSISAVANSGSGIYTATFTAVGAGSALTIGANVGGSAVSSTLPQVTVVAGSFSLAQSSVSVSAGTVASGGQVVVTLTPKDAAGNVTFSSGLSVAFTQSGGTSTGSFSSANYNSGAGTYTGTFTGVLAGTATSIGATVGGVAVSSSLPTITVSAGALSLATSLITSSSPSVASGGNVTFTLTAKDAAGNLLGAAANGLTIVFTTSGGTSTGTMSAVTNSGNGVYTATFTGLVAGTALNIGATVGGSAVSSSLPQITVEPGSFSLAQSSVSVSASSVVSGGQVDVTLTARDANQNRLTSGGLTVVFTQSIAGMGQFSTVVDGGNGLYTSNFTGILAGGPDQLSATLNGSPLTSAAAGVTVTAGAVSLANSSFSANPTTLTSGSTSALSVTVRDANNNSKSGATVSFAITSGTGTGTFSSVVDAGNGSYTSTFTSTGAGSAVIQASVNGSALGTVSMTINSGGMSLEVPIEMIDTPLAAKTSTQAFELSRTPIVTTYYDGSPQYFFEVVASNSDSSSRAVALVDSAGNVKASISIPASSSSKRYKVGFTPNTGSDQYRLRLGATSSTRTFAVYTARILVQQTNATKTRLYVPLLGNVYSDVTSSSDHWIDRCSGGSYMQSYPARYNIWQKNMDNLATIPSGNAFQLDTVLWAKDGGSSNYWWDRYYNWDDDNYSNSSNNDSDDDDDNSSRQNINATQCSAGLINAQTGAEVSGSQISTTSESPNFMSSSFPNSAANFPDQAFYEVRIKRTGNSGQCYLGKAGLWITLDPLIKGEVYYRVAKGYSWSVPSWATDHSRVYLDLGLFSGNVSTYFETTGYGSNGSNLVFRLKDGGTNDSGSSSSTVNCGGSSTNLGNSRSRYRSNACSGISNGHRYYHEITSGSGNLYSGSSCVIVNFH